MLSRKVNHRVILAGISIAALSCLVASTIVAEDATHGDSRLSKQDMEDVVGGYSCCDGCGTDSTVHFHECYHGQEFTDPRFPGIEFAHCTQDSCCHYVYNSDSCSPNQSELDDGCDNDEPDIPASGVIGYVYFYDIQCPADPWTQHLDWAKSYYGCASDYTCNVHIYRGWCEAPYECDGDFDHTEDKGTKYECGTCP